MKMLAANFKRRKNSSIYGALMSADGVESKTNPFVCVSVNEMRYFSKNADILMMRACTLVHDRFASCALGCRIFLDEMIKYEIDFIYSRSIREFYLYDAMQKDILRDFEP